MDNIIRELVAIDRQARQKVADARQRHTSEKELIAQEKAQLGERYLHRTQQKLEIIRRHAQEQAQSAREALEKDYGARQQALCDAFAQQGDQWLEQIVCRCRQP